MNEVDKKIGLVKEQQEEHEKIILELKLKLKIKETEIRAMDKFLNLLKDLKSKLS